MLPARLAIVVPIYNEQENLSELRRRLTQVCDGIPDIQWQVIYVDDGSTDGSPRIMLAQHGEDPRFAVVRLARNFGQQAAISAGLAHADCDAAVVMDGDLQDPPEVIPELLAAWRDGGQVVLAKRTSRRERGWRRLGIALFHRLFAWVSDYSIASGTGIFGLLDRRALDEFVQLSERNRFIPGLWCWVGFDRRTVCYDRRERAAGKPKQTFGRLVKYALDATFSFSYRPLRIIMLAGALIGAIGLVLGCVFLVRSLLSLGQTPRDLTWIMAAMLFMGGIQLIGIALLAGYVGRMYDEVKARPLYIVRSLHGLAAASESKGRRQ